MSILRCLIHQESLRVLLRDLLARHSPHFFEKARADVLGGPLEEMGPGPWIFHRSSAFQPSLGSVMSAPVFAASIFRGVDVTVDLLQLPSEDAFDSATDDGGCGLLVESGNKKH